MFDKRNKMFRDATKIIFVIDIMTENLILIKMFSPKRSHTERRNGIAFGKECLRESCCACLKTSGSEQLRGVRGVCNSWPQLARREYPRSRSTKLGPQ